MHRYPRQKGQLFAANTFTTSLTPLQVSKMLVNVTIVVRRPTKEEKKKSFHFRSSLGLEGIFPFCLSELLR